MPVINIYSKKIVLVDYSYQPLYWGRISQYIIDEFEKIGHDVGTYEEKDPNEVEELLNGCFSILEDSFNSFLSAELRASFYLFIHNFHENSTFIYFQQLRGLQFDSKLESEMAVSRRVTKIILEQACRLDLVSAPSYGKEMMDNYDTFLKIYEELLYIGAMAIELSEFIAQNQIAPFSIGLRINENKDLEVLKFPPYKNIVDYVMTDMQEHNQKVVLNECMSDFKENLDSCGVSQVYDKMVSPLFTWAKQCGSFQFLLLQNVKTTLNNNENIPTQFMDDFFAGLTVTRQNVLTFAKCIRNNQDVDRYMYRPFLEYKVDGQLLYLFGENKWQESFMTLSTNAIPFGILPRDWSRIKYIKKFSLNLKKNNDKVLEEPIWDLLDTYNIKYCKNVVSLVQKNKQHIRVDKQGVGEIDILYLDEAHKEIYVCDCKNNRSRFDWSGWRRDYDAFEHKYKKQLKQKVNWISDNVQLVQEHFEVKFSCELDLSDYEVKGIFLINAPSVYMYNGSFRAFTIHGFEHYLNNTFEAPKFRVDDIGYISHPYFKNALKISEKLD